MNLWIFTRRRVLASALLLLVALALLSLTAGIAGATPPARGGTTAQVPGTRSVEFERNDTAIKVNKDGSLTVRETLVANFTGQYFYFYRDLPSDKPSVSEGKFYGKIRFSDIKVFTVTGEPYENFKIEKLRNGKRVRINFNALNEQMGWIVQYKMTGAIIYAKNYDRLYYNTIANWSVPIKSSRATVQLPPGTNMNKVKTTQYYEGGIVADDITSGFDGKVLWWEVKNIPPYGKFTIDVAFPKGVVAVPLTFTTGFGVATIILAVVLALGVSAWMILLWWRKGRDVGAPELDVVQYTPPPDLKPMEAAFLTNESTSASDISATIVDLAIRGKLVITEQESGKLLKHKEYGFQLKDDSGEGLDSYEKEIMNSLFESGKSVTEEDLENKFYTHISDITDKVKEQALSKDLFDGDPGKVKHRYTLIALGVLLLIVPVVLANIWIDPGYLYVLIPGLAVAGVMIFIVGRFMPRRTAKGSQALSYVKGFKEYMGTAEAGEMEYMTPENFQTNLPYAMVLGVAKQWAGKFADIYTSPPDWYVSSPGTTFSTLYLADSLTSMQTSVGSTLASSPSSSGGGGGGGFGGGSAGGGVGGGGGGFG
jgi:uncharacterized membrane protein YgcG